MKSRVLCLTAATASMALASFASGQVLPAQPPALSHTQSTAIGQTGPHDYVDAQYQPASHTMMLERESALYQPMTPPAGGYTNMEPGVGIGAGLGHVDPGDDNTSNFINQPYNCDTGYLSNNNSDTSPFLRFDDFIADGNPLRNVTFYGGVYNNSSGRNGSLDKLASIGIEIWTIQAGGECGWAFDSFVGGQTFTLAELNPTFVCDTGGFYNAYKMTAQFGSALSLNANQNYMITIYGTLNDGTSSYLFIWNQSNFTNFNPADSWSRTTSTYAGCGGPDNAFATNSFSYNQPNDCNTTCYYSNSGSNMSPFVALDDFIAPSSDDLHHLQFTGGGWDISAGAPTSLANIDSFLIELYHSVPDNGFPCGNWNDAFYGSYTVNKADANAVFDCIDIFGIAHYQFSIDIPGGTYPLVEGDHYLLGVSGIPSNPDDSRIFCWGGTNGLYNFTSWSFNTTTDEQETCHDVDAAFGVNTPAPCLGDYNGSGNVDTQDFLAFLNDWSAHNPGADLNTDGTVNTQDFLIFLNRWSAGC